LTAPEPPPEVQAAVNKRERRRRGAVGWFITFLTIMVLLVAAVGLVGRFAVLTPQGRLFLEARTSGLDLGPIGKLRIEGLAGDIWHDFGIRRLTISDEKGVWLEAHGLAVAWRPMELFTRRLHISSVTAADLRLLRRPTLAPKKKDMRLPVSIAIDKLATKLETLPAFSTERGLFDLGGGFKVERQGGASGQIKAASLLHAGDGLTADFQYGKGKAVKLNADAIESNGGAIAGALGLPAKLPFTLNAKVAGTLSGGTLNIIARSGATTPLQATGGWNGQGAQADGRVELSASSLMTRVVTMFGPTAEIHTAARRTPAGLYDGSVKIQTENLGLSASGAVKADTRSTPGGLAFQADVKDLSRIVSVPAMKAGIFKGRLAGSLTDLSAKGMVTVTNLALAGYSLDQASGPLEVRFAKKVLSIKTDLSGTGGAGEGLFAAWMGPQPKVSAGLERQANGAFLIQSLQGVGAGMKIDAKGSRTLLGGYAFDGQAELSNLAAAYKGASGVVKAQMSIRHDGLDQPWRFTADAKGADFATGYPALDRLLGTTPHLVAAAERATGGVWTVSKGDLDGEQASAAATGQFGPDNALKLAVNWRAKGPFAAGPVEIAGAIKGDGQITGTISEPRADLNANIEAIDLPRLPLKDAKLALTFMRGADGSSGAVKLTAASDYGPALASANFRLTQAGLDLSNLDARAGGATAAGLLALRDGQPSRADLTLTLANGAFLDQGTVNAKVNVTDAASGAAGQIKVTASNIGFGPNSDLTLRTVSLTGDGPLAKMPFVLKADATKAGIPITVAGSGLATETGQAYAVSFNGQGQYRKTSVRTIEPLIVNFGGPELSAQGALSVGGGRADVEARQSGDTISLRAALAGVDLSIADEDLAGKFDATLTATGKAKELSGDLNATMTEARSRDGPRAAAINANVKGSLRGDKLTVSAAATNQNGLKSSASVTVPAEASAVPFRVAINRKKPMEGRFDIDGELQPVWDLFFGGERTLGGHLVAQGTLGGSLGDPRLAGQANLANGRFEDSITGLKLRNVTVAANLDQDAITVTKFAAADTKSGTLSGAGKISLERAGASTFTVNANKFLLIANDLATAEATGAVTVTRDADGKAALKGKLTIDRADVVADPPIPSGVVPMDVVEINLPAGREVEAASSTARGPAFTLDVTLTAPQKIFVKGRGLDAELSLDAHVGGTTAAPVLTGVAKVIRGSYDFAGKRFEFDPGGTVYLATRAERIRLAITATRDDPSLTAVVKIAGTAAKPEITLTSTPILPNDEVLSQVLFGKSAAQLSPLEAAQMASALTGLATGGGFDVIGGLRSLAGLDRLALSGGDSTTGGVSVSGGKYITDNVYLELTGGGREGPSAQVEWRVRRSLSIISRLATGTGDSRLSVRWRKEYGKRTPAKPAL
jgi:translocation and assembly module TamB